MTASLKILALVTDAFGGKGGIAQYNRDFITALSACPRIASIDILPRLCVGEAEGLPVRTRQFKPRYNQLWYSVGAFVLAIRCRPNVVFCGHPLMVTLAAPIAKVCGAKLVIQAHGTDVRRRPSPTKRTGLEAADLILAVSRDTRARILNWLNIAPERIVVVPNTVSDDFTPSGGSSVRATLGLQGKIVLLTLSRLDGRERYKGHDQVIPLIQSLRKQGHDVVYLIAGDGDDRPRLEVLVREYGVAEHVRFLGAMPQDQLPALYRAADLYVMPSTGEGFGIAFLEAMACGTPALGLAAGGAVDALGDGELGIVTTNQDLFSAIDGCLRGSKPDRQALSAKVKARFGSGTFQRRVNQIVDAFV